MTPRRTRRIAVTAALAVAVGLGLAAVSGGAGAAPQLPARSAQELIASVLAAEPDAFGGTVELDNSLGLPPLPDLPQAGDGTSTARVWSDGAGRGRLALPSGDQETTVVFDGESVWAYDSATRTAVRSDHGPGGARPPQAAMADPTTAATQAIAALRETSSVTVDGTAEVAGRPAYELVLAPNPTERTLLREVRVAVDAQRRVPLRLTVLAIGSPDPVLQLGFTDLDLGPQDPELFTFTPPPGTTVSEPREVPEPGPRPQPSVVGDGWDTVLLAELPAADPGADPDARGMLAGLGTPVSGPWGSGRLISTAVATAILTDDGRVAAGAVPEQVLTEALAR